jgi:hypothetical protein
VPTDKFSFRKPLSSSAWKWLIIRAESDSFSAFRIHLFLERSDHLFPSV